MVLRPVVSIGEIRAMDSLLSYESSSSSTSDGEAWTETQPPMTKRAIEQAPPFATLEDDALMDRCASDSEVSDSNDEAPKFGSERFHPTDGDQLDENELEEQHQQNFGSRGETEAFGGGGNMHATFPLPVGGKRSPYALNIRDLNARMRAFLASVKTYFTQRVNLERQKATLCPLTYGKAQERVLGTYVVIYVSYSVHAQRLHTHV